MLVIALSKGRFLEPSLELLARAGIRFTEDVPSSRKLIFTSDDKEFRARVRLDTPREREYLRHGGILPFVLRRLLG